MVSVGHWINCVHTWTHRIGRRPNYVFQFGKKISHEFVIELNAPRQYVHSANRSGAASHSLIWKCWPTIVDAYQISICGQMGDTILTTVQNSAGRHDDDDDDDDDRKIYEQRHIVERGKTFFIAPLILLPSVKQRR